MDMSHVNQVWPNPSGKVQWKGGEDKADGGIGRETTSGMDRPGVRQVPGSSGEQGKMEETSCEIISGALTTDALKE